MRMSVDIETYSSIELAGAGVYHYVEAPDFDILLIGYSIDGGPVEVIDCTEEDANGNKRCEQDPRFHQFLKLLLDPDVTKHAFNANFERTCFARWLQCPMPPEEWRCTMIKCLTLGLPGSLAAAGMALGLPEEKLKDPKGKRLIQYFSKPCKPTKANGGRERNMPWHDPEKWNLYIEYNRQDVVTEMEIASMLDKYSIPQSEQDLWSLDQRMNDTGVRLDVPTIEGVIAEDARRKDELRQKARDLTGLSNPNSMMQLKAWLAEQGVTMTSVTKDSMAEALKRPDLPPAVREVLEIRRALGKTSVAKYRAMADAVCDDGRLRGILQFYGANRSGRWAGRLVQTHNLAKNSLPDLELARELTAEGRFDELATLFGEPAFVFSELIRPMFIPSEGCRFVVSDFSAIEARVISWIAGEEWRLEAFRDGKDIYCETASQMYHVPVVKHGVNGELRQKGKVAELACIAEGQLVLTDHGLKAIETVTTDDKVWDGIEWVNHEGVIYRGIKEVITYDGLTATTDHIVWAEVEGQYRQVRFGDAASSGSHLVRSGSGGHPVRLGEDHLSGKTIHERMARRDGADRTHQLRTNQLDKLFKSDTRQKQGLPVVQPETGGTRLDGEAIHGGQATVRESKGSGLSQLRSTRDPLRVSVSDGCMPVHDRDVRDSGQRNGDRPDRQQRRLCSGKPQICDPERELRQQTDNSSVGVRSEVLAVCGNCSPEEAGRRANPGGDHCGCGDCCIREAEELARNRGQVKVYDIRLAGPRNRYTVSEILVHNCGYQGGVGAMKRMDKGGAIPEEELQAVVDHWREANPKVVKLWRKCEAAAKKCIEERRTVKARPDVIFSYVHGNMFIQLPSGRKLCYWGTKLKQDPRDGKMHIIYQGVNQTTRQWCETETYGGKLVENIVQAIARDCLAVSMTRVTEMRYSIVMHVHDEMIVDVPRADKDALDRINGAMAAPISWAPGLPLRGDGYEAEFYMKD